MAERRSYGPKGPAREQDGFQDKVLDLRRVTRVVAGGKRFRFRATVVVGDGAGHVGVGIGKSIDVPSAIAKGRAAAKKNIITVELDKRSIVHEVEAKFSAAHIRIKPASEGHGMRAGGAARVVAEQADQKPLD
jgi:small subunit ribosomal protein S5